MKKSLLFITTSLLFLSISFSCKKKEQKIDDSCTTRNLILGKWKFVSRKVTDYKTGEPSTPASNVTVNFDPESYIEFTSDNKFRWYEIYKNKVYRDQSGTTLCVSGDTFYIYSKPGTGIAESIKELTPTKLVFTNNVLGIHDNWVQTVTLELSK